MQKHNNGNLVEKMMMALFKEGKCIKTVTVKTFALIVISTMSHLASPIYLL